MGFDFAASEITADTGKIIPSKDIVLFTERHPLRFDSGSHKGDGWNIERRSTVQRPRIVADKCPTSREEGEEFS